MIKNNDKIKVHFFNWATFPEKLETIKTRQDGTIYTVKTESGKVGIDYNNEFTPFERFATCVGFENIETKKIYHYSNLAEAIAEINE